MTDDPKVEQAANDLAGLTRPYPPGWLDRLADWVDRLPGPSWQYYVGLLVVQLVYVTMLWWIDDKTPIGSIDLRRGFFVAITPYFLWVRSHLDRIAGAALDAFRPALTVSDAEFARLRYELTTLPARNTLIATALAVLIFLGGVPMLPTIVQEYTPSLVAVLIQFGPLLFLLIATTMVCTYHAIYQLQMVTHIHGFATRINLFQSPPLYVFSGLTARTGASFLLLVYFVSTVRPDLAFGGRVATALLLTMIPLAVASFVLPLRGMHQQIAAEKKRLLAESNRRIELLIAALHQRIDDGVLADADKLNMQLTSLATERVMLEKISTWPWRAQTLTGFVSTLVLPLILWLLKYALERFGF